MSITPSKNVLILNDLHKWQLMKLHSDSHFAKMICNSNTMCGGPWIFLFNVDDWRSLSFQDTQWQLYAHMEKYKKECLKKVSVSKRDCKTVL